MIHDMFSTDLVARCSHGERRCGPLAHRLHPHLIELIHTWQNTRNCYDTTHNISCGNHATHCILFLRTVVRFICCCLKVWSVLNTMQSPPGQNISQASSLTNTNKPFLCDWYTKFNVSMCFGSTINYLGLAFCWPSDLVQLVAPLMGQGGGRL